MGKDSEMNNEPVAWMSQGGDVSRSKDYFEEMGFKDLIPLYTHPAELTDEEIKSVWGEMVCSVHMTKSELDFAKAILRKAQDERK